MAETKYQRDAREQAERRNRPRGGKRKAKQKAKRAAESNKRIADCIDGYDRDDLGESPDY